jgi:hypothetical protein
MKKYLILAAAAIAGMAIVGCSSETGTDDVKSIQADMKKDVPKDSGEVPKELAQKDLANPAAGAPPGQKGAYMRNNLGKGAGGR